MRSAYVPLKIGGPGGASQVPGQGKAPVRSTCLSGCAKPALGRRPNSASRGLMIADWVADWVADCGFYCGAGGRITIERLTDIRSPQSSIRNPQSAIGSPQSAA